MSDQEESELTVNKIGTRMPISDELAMEYGLIPDTRPPVVITRRERIRRRVRWAVAGFRRRLGIRVGSWIANEDLDPDYYD
ncbi:hypothetical protein AB0C10_37675 [Microbispora amethystogenes]|uniref:hypothetical protein n=1 Tax=Microbispora amethystogenes TaxID=1427754 RepID=UPI0033EB07D0